jgi:hypothetical protein
MTIEEQVKDAVDKLFILMSKETTDDEDEGMHWFNSIPILIVTPVDPEQAKEVIIKSLLKWIPEQTIFERSGFIIQNVDTFNKWYEKLKLKLKLKNNDTSTTHSVT